MNTKDHLASLGVSLEQAHSFVMAHLGDPATIYNVAKQFKINSQMLADIVAPSVPGVSALQVEAFFNAHGLKGSNLNANEIVHNNDSLLWQNATELAWLYNFNQNTGTLSTQSLRDTIVSKVGMTAYIKAFSPSDLPGSADGVLSTTDLGFSHLGNIQATWQNVESLYYGTLINAHKNISASEAAEVNAFADANLDALDSEDPRVIAEMKLRIVNMLVDPVDADDTPYLSDKEIAEALVSDRLEVINLMGKYNQHENPFNYLIIF